MADELLTIQELGERLKIKPDTVREKMRLGIFKKGVHYYRRRGLRPLFKWSAVVAWLEEKEQEQSGSQEKTPGISMAKRYMLGGSEE